MRKEPIVFAVIAVLGGLYVVRNTGKAAKQPIPRQNSLDYEAALLPELDRSAAPRDREVDFGRDLFTRPRDTSPLPPLTPTLPALEPLGVLDPPTVWGPAPQHHAKFLRVDAPPRDPVPGLFDPLDEEPTEAVVEEVDLDDPDQRAARIESFKRQFDWVYTNDFKFGQIRNEDRYRLSGRSDPIRLYEVDPRTGKSRYGNDLVSEFTRDRIQEFGFAATPTNELELGRIAFGASLTPVEFERALQFAQRCIELRNEAPRALELAEEMYRLADAVNTQADPRPKLGLARCFELGFQFERAFEVYEELLRTTGGTNPRVIVRLAELRAMLRLDERAEADYRRALDLSRTDWEVRASYGRFLLERGRVDEALAQLAAAADHEPRGDEDLTARVRLRGDHAAALLAAGRPEEARERFSRALSGDLEDEAGRAQFAVAGIAASALVLGLPPNTNGALPAAPTSASSDAGFELLHTSGLYALDRRQWAESRTALELARRADPFRTYLPLGALSVLAERTANPEDALSFAQEAFTANPTDVWTLYQRGRLLLATGDSGGAEESFRAALDHELDHTPSLEELGALRFEQGDYEAAALYFDRALALDPKRGVVWSRRGYDHLMLGNVPEARECFQRARLERPGLASAAAGIAWCAYLAGDSEEALTLFGQLEEDRRDAGSGDPVRAYAKAQGELIREHERKEVWRDRFDREPGRIANDWTTKEGFGPQSILRDGAVTMEGLLQRTGRTRVQRLLAADRFISFFADVTVKPSANGTTSGIFLSVETGGTANEPIANGEILVGRDRNGAVVVKVRKTASDDAQWVTPPATPSWPIGEPVRIGIERVGTDTQGTFTVYVAGEPVLTDIKNDPILRFRREVTFGLFTEGDPNRTAGVVMDDVEVVRNR